MPRLPDINDLGSRPVPVNRGGVVSRPRAGIVGDAVEGLGQQLTSSGQQMFEKQDKLAYAAAKTAILKADVQARTELQNDNDYGTFEARYTEKMKAARDQARKLIGNSSDRSLFDSDTDLDFERGRSQVLEMANTKRVSARLATLSDGLDALGDAGRDAPDEGTRSAIIGNANEMFDAAFKEGLIPADKAATGKREWASSYIAQQVTGKLLVEDYDGARAVFDKNVDKLDWRTAQDLQLDLKRMGDSRQSYSDAISTAPGFTSVHGGGAIVSDPIGFVMHDLEGGAQRVVDSGGVTRYGVSQNANPDVDVKNLTEEQARKIYKERYWDKLNLDSLPPQLALVVFDTAINHGVDKAKEMLANSRSVSGILMQRKAEYERLIRENPEKYKRYEKGWMNRLDRVAGGDAPVPDLATWTSNIDRKAQQEGWSFERRERAKDAAKSEVGSFNSARAQRENEADRQASEAILGLRERFTDTSQIPRDVWNNMSPSSRASAMNAAEANSRPKEPEANGPLMWQAHAIMYSDPKSFAGMDLSQYVGKVTRAEMDSLISEQAKLRASGGAQTSIRGNISGALDFYTSLDPDLRQKLSKKDDPEAYSRVFQDMEAFVLSQTKGQRDPTDAELKAAFGRATMKVMVPGALWGSNEMRRFEVEPGQTYQVEVPQTVRQRIIAAYQRQNGGRTPPDGLVGSIYVQNKGKPGFWN